MKEEGMSRRRFLTGAATVGAAAVAAPALLASCSGGNNKLTPLKKEGEYYLPELPDKAIDGPELKVGLIGCGGRGSGAIINLLDAADNIKVTALGDVFEDRLNDVRNRLKNERGQEVPTENCFVGFDAYKQVIDSGVDMVILTTPPVFRPEHFKYATEKGVHSFLEKPIAV
ncbi:MAG: Gfo/Idh/MocA family oxidoreductase, partial [Prevotella sp.]